MSQAQQAYEEIMKQLQDVAQKNGDDFHIKVLRRNTEGDPLPAQFACFNQATLNHIINREEWLPALVGEDGGGVFDIHVYDGETRTKAIFVGPHIRTRVNGSGTATTPNLQALMDKGWRGPRVLTFPDPRTLQRPTATTTVQATASTAPSVTLQDARNAALAAPTGTAAATQDAATTRLLDAASQLAKQKEELAEQRHMLELTKIRNETELRMQQLRAEMQQTQQVKQSGGDLLEKLPALLTALGAIVGPIVASVSEAAKERNRQLVEAQKEAAAAAREAAKISAEATEKQFSALRETVEKIVEKRDDGSSDVYKKMSEATTTMAGTMMQMVHQMAELPQGEPAEPGWVKAITAISDTIRDVATKVVEVNGNRPRPQLPPRAALPAPQPPVAPQPPATQAAVTQQPQPVANDPAPVANEVDVLEGMIREKYPVEQIRDYFFTILPKNDMAQALAKHDGDFEALIKARLNVWLLNPENASFMEQLGESITAKGIELGLIKSEAKPEEQAQPDGDSEEEEETEEEEEVTPQAEA